MTDLVYCAFETVMGWVGLAASETGIRQTTLPHPTAAAARRDLQLPVSARRAESDFTDTIRRLRDYFSGHPVDFPEPVDPATATPFQKSIWECARLIPYGETRSYGYLAERVYRPQAARAVGQALARNPLPVIIPCHRVLTSQGHIGGFRGGPILKQRLLALEAAGISRSPLASRTDRPGF